ncbi:ImmA/IrrE family metallo-endopeptidase [Paraburkholderia kururiensis]|uniref:XRE family transcriptional regulator n=1 Tax=Paraburkholderia kururiensis TaxID=984307 RepID=A0ABZ0WML4_9BURK|nr:XRE family transcriptional regulator [Paraburkholderia kururiensis]WQD78511.1 XRE family transcriptional regulator [Paraburkholderia kururiensis]
MPQVNPQILVWARETAGLSIDGAAKSLQLGGARQSGTEALGEYEKGTRAPSRPLLLKMAKVYRRPLLTFYLPQPPVKSERGEDFRTLPGGRAFESAPTLDALVRDVFVRQRLVKSILEDTDEAEPLNFVGSMTLGQPVDYVAKVICKRLSFDLNEFRRKRTVEESFSYMRGLTEQLGVFVLLIGNLGTHHTALSTDVFRGFALAEKVAPFIVVNDQDAKVAWSFTLLHELAHIWLGRTGLSGADFEQKIEQFCNDIASEILLPEAEIDDLGPLGDDRQKIMSAISDFASRRKVSRTLVAYRLLKRRKIHRNQWADLTEEFRRSWEAERAKKKEEAADAAGGPNYYVVKRHRVGNALVEVTRRAIAEGFVTPTKAGRILGVKPANVQALVAPA